MDKRFLLGLLIIASVGCTPIIDDFQQVSADALSSDSSAGSDDVVDAGTRDAAAESAQE